MLSQLRGVLVAGVVASQRAVHCRLVGHTWTDRCYPPACTQCGRSQLPLLPSDGAKETTLAA
jgi:hypothetical protein